MVAISFTTSLFLNGIENMTVAIALRNVRVSLMLNINNVRGAMDSQDVGDQM